jgi:phage/plasmid-associated DNA primase
MFKTPHSEGYDLSGKPVGAVKAHDWTSGSELYSNYKEWCDENGHRRPVAVQEFKRRVEKIGYPSIHTRKGNFFGLRLLKKAQDAADSLAKRENTPVREVKDAISILNGGSNVVTLKIPNTSLPRVKDEGFNE